MTDFKPDFTKPKSDQPPAEVPSGSPEPSGPERSPLDEATYDHQRFVRLPGVDVSGSHPHRPPAHLLPAPVAPEVVQERS